MLNTKGKDVNKFLLTEWNAGRNPPIRFIAREMAKGLKYLHTRSIIHQDIKPGNAIISINPLRVQLIDFGISKIYYKGRMDFVISGGTPGYLCKQYYTRGKIEGPEADVYSFGYSVLKMFFYKNKTPFPEEFQKDHRHSPFSKEEIYQLFPRIKNTPDNILDDRRHSTFCRLLLGTLPNDSSERWTMSAILNSEWIQQPDD